MKTGSVLQTIKPPTGFGRFCLDVSGTKCIIGKPLDLEEHSNPSTLQRASSDRYFLWLVVKATLSGCFNIIWKFFPLRFELEDQFSVFSLFLEFQQQHLSEFVRCAFTFPPKWGLWLLNDWNLINNISILDICAEGTRGSKTGLLETGGDRTWPGVACKI